MHKRCLSVAVLTLVLATSAMPGRADARSSNGESAKPNPARQVQARQNPPRQAQARAPRAPSAHKAAGVARTPARASPTVRTAAAPREAAPARRSIGQAIGLHQVDDPLDLRSSVALVVDQQSGQVLFAKNPDAVLPIASITKLMTALVVLDAQQPLAETLTISEADIDTEKGSRSRLAPGTRLSRGELLQLALMSSENRAANALGRYYPGGLPAFVEAMNTKALALGMRDTRYVEPTGLSSRNVSNARDLSMLVRAGLEYPLVRQFSTASDLTVGAGQRQLIFRNTNRLIASPSWEIGLQKTGYISEAGSCVVMQAGIDGRAVVMVLLDAVGMRSRWGDAEKLRHWLAAHPDRPMVIRASRVQPSVGS